MAVTKIRAGQVDSSIIVAGGSNAFSANQSLGGFKITNLGTPTAGGDAATKTYVDNLTNGKDWKESCRVASTANVDISSAPATIDGVTLSANDRILLKNQTDAGDNGFYIFNGAASALTRSVDGGADQLTSGATTFITEGTANAGKEFNLTTADPITVGTTDLTFTQSGAGSTYTGTNGIDVTGTVISPTYGSSANTVCQGDDSRLSNARTPVGTALTSTQVWVGNGSNVAAAVALSGDVTITNAGVATVANQVKLSKYIVRETPSGSINSSNTEFTLAATPVSGTEQVFLNGLLQEPGGEDYAISSATITFTTAPATGDRLRVTYISQ